MLVHVLNRDGRALMPCHPAKARILLKEGKAKPVKSKTGYFTIQLLYGSSGYKQEIVVGIDTGAKRVSIAAVGSCLAAKRNGKVYYAKEKILRTDVKKQLTDRARYRRTRRTRSTRYRPPRFHNRVKTKCARCGVNNVPKLWKKVKRKNGKSLKRVCNGRASLCRRCSLRSPTTSSYGQGKKGQHNRPHILAPSVLNRAESIINDIHKLSQTLPISKIVVEIASFDTQKMANALIEGVEYQHGTLLGFEVKQYLLTVHKHKCAYCGGLSGLPSNPSSRRSREVNFVSGESCEERSNHHKPKALVSEANTTEFKGDGIPEIEHIYPKSKGGTDKISNLTISCRVCNIEKGSMTLEQWERVLRANPSEINEKRLKNIPALKKQSKLKKGFQYSSLTQSYKNYLLAELRKDFTVGVTFGAKTKYHRTKLGLSKSQINDALVIASEGKSFFMPEYYVFEKQIKKRYPHDYISPPKKRQPIVKYKREVEMFGFRLWDFVCLVLVNCASFKGCVDESNAHDKVVPRIGTKLREVIGYVQGRRSSGSFAIASLDGELLIGGISYKKLNLLKKAKSNYIRERRAASSPTDSMNQ